MRSLIYVVLVFGVLTSAWAQTATPDTTPRAPDTLYVIPAGPVAGMFTPAARVSIEDTMAGWARVRIEGWVPVQTVLGRMLQGTITPAPDLQSSKAGKEARAQCAAITKKGTRCKRMAAPGSKYCWQHQNQK